MAKMGRKPIFDTEEKLRQLKELMRLSPTLADTAAFFECGQTTVEETIRNHYDLTFRDFRQQNAVHTRLMLRRTAVQMAKAGNVPMLIFALKNLCGWADKLEHTGDKEKPIYLSKLEDKSDAIVIDTYKKTLLEEE